MEDDAKKAKERGLSFQVMVKAGRGKPWTTAQSGMNDLREALASARGQDFWEVAVFVEGYIYWSSQSPDCFNSTVIWSDHD